MGKPADEWIITTNEKAGMQHFFGVAGLKTIKRVPHAQYT